MQPENVLKGRIAETLVDQLLRRAGFHVYRFGYEAVLQNLTQIEERVFADPESDIVRQIRSIPDFLVVKNGRPLFVEVKFKSRIKTSFFRKLKGDRDFLEQLQRIDQFWQAKVIIVTLRSPCFRVADPPYILDNKLDCRSIVEDKDLGVTTEFLPEFERLVEEYLGY